MSQCIQPCSGTARTVVRKEGVLMAVDRPQLCIPHGIDLRKCIRCYEALRDKTNESRVAADQTITACQYGSTMELYWQAIFFAQIAPWLRFCSAPFPRIFAALPACAAIAWHIPRRLCGDSYTPMRSFPSCARPEKFPGRSHSKRRGGTWADRKAFSQMLHIVTYSQTAQVLR